MPHHCSATARMSLKSGDCLVIFYVIQIWKDKQYLDEDVRIYTYYYLHISKASWTTCAVVACGHLRAGGGALAALKLRMRAFVHIYARVSAIQLPRVPKLVKLFLMTHKNSYQYLQSSHFRKKNRDDSKRNNIVVFKKHHIQANTGLGRLIDTLNKS